jgi:signal transduction histidine kinase
LTKVAGSPAAGALTRSNPEIPARGAGTAGRAQAVRDQRLHQELVLDVHIHRFEMLEADMRALAGRLAAAEEAAAAAQEALRAQVELMARVSHELRRPLQPIVIAAETLERIGVDPGTANLRAIIGRQALHLARFVDDLLDVSRIATGKLGLDRSVVDLRDIVAIAVETCLPTIEDRRQRLTATVADEALAVWGDPVRLVQVLGNLLDNASRYTPEGGSIELVAGVDAGTVRLSVSDSGIGIGGEALPHVFEAFARTAAVSAGGGMGLGLTLARELVAAHGGSIAAQSAGVGLGSRFVVTLPTAGPLALRR